MNNKKFFKMRKLVVCGEEYSRGIRGVNIVFDRRYLCFFFYNNFILDEISVLLVVIIFLWLFDCIVFYVMEN